MLYYMVVLICFCNLALHLKGLLGDFLPLVQSSLYCPTADIWLAAAKTSSSNSKQNKNDLP